MLGPIAARKEGEHAPGMAKADVGTTEHAIAKFDGVGLRLVADFLGPNPIINLEYYVQGALWWMRPALQRRCAKHIALLGSLRQF
jgi:hypothetical protein